MKRRGGGTAAGRTTSAGTAAMCVAAMCVAAMCVAALAGLPAQQAWAAGEPAPYAFAEDVRAVKGASTTSDAPQLAAGGTYKDAVKRDGKLIYRVDLDDATNAYVSAVVVPKPGVKVAYRDELKLSLQDRDGTDCSSNSAQFGSAEFARPLAVYAYRTLGESSCQEAGSYYVVVERESLSTSSQEPWDLEIRHVLEPKLKAAGPTAAPEEWPSASPEPPPGGPRERAGGTSFSDAPGLGEGEWTDRIKPGESRFYRVPVDWGQQLYVSADLGSSSGDGFVGDALPVSLYNPALGLVDSVNSLAYNGRQKSSSFDPLPPVRYENRFSSDSEQEHLRFAGWYYLRVSLNPKVGEKFGAKPYGLTLRVSLEGKAEPAPAYAGPPGIFAVTEEDRAAAADGQSGTEAGRSGTMRLVAAGGIGAGTLLLLVLGAWTLLGRRRAAAGAPGAPVSPDAPTQYGPPTAW